LNNADLTEIGFSKTTDEMYFHLATLAQNAGASGVVASAQDYALLRENLAINLSSLPPGITQCRRDNKRRSKKNSQCI